MKKLNILIISIFIWFYYSCTKDDNQKTVPTPCVAAETITDTISGFLIFGKGKQEKGYSKGIKINKPFESSVFLFDNITKDSTIDIQLKGYWPENNGHFAEGEYISFYRIKNSQKCQNLSNNRETIDSVNALYTIVNDDVGILGYELDLTGDNSIEIISFDSVSKKLKAKFKASFIAKNEY